MRHFHQFAYVRVVLRPFAALLLTLLPISAGAQKVTLIAVGDVCLANGVEQAMERKGRGYPFAALKPYLRSADVAFCNLECCLGTVGEKVEKKYNFRGHPRGAQALAEAGFQVVSLANNHSLDYGKEALSETVRLLSRAGVKSAGGGQTLAEAYEPQIVSVKGVRVAFLAYLGLFPSVVPLRHGEPGVAMAELLAIRHGVRKAAKQADFVIVSLHAGKEYTFTHDARQEAIAHAAIDAGAEMVIGHHPHVVQDSEVYRGKPIFYSLGNFVFNPSPTFLSRPDQPWSGMVVATLEKGQDPDAHLIDLRIVDRQPNWRHADDGRTVGDILSARQLETAAKAPYGAPRFTPALKTQAR